MFSLLHLCIIQSSLFHSGVTSVITTIGGGFLLDLNSFKGHRLHIYNGLNLLFGLSCFGTASSMHYAGFVVSAILRGASSGLVSNSMPLF